MDEAKLLVWMTFLFLILFMGDSSRSVEKNKIEFNLIANLVVIYTAVSSIVGLIYMVMQHSVLYHLPNGVLVHEGFVWGRLWGIYMDPNMASVVCSSSTVLSLYFLRKSKKIPLKIAYGLNILFQLLYISFSDSRTGALCLCISCAIYIFLTLQRYPIKNKRVFAKQILCVIAAILVAMGTLGAVESINKVYNAMAFD